MADSKNSQEMVDDHVDECVKVSQFHTNMYRQCNQIPEVVHAIIAGQLV